jgi:dihydropteroate synthase
LTRLEDLLSAPGRRRPLVMGVLNVTPDSFSDGGCHAETTAAVEAGLRLLAEGADLLDIGGESTRPGSEPVSAQQELDRIGPVIEALAARTDRPLSVDTLKPDVARAAISAGASIWNDVAALRGERGPETATELGCSVILMHMQGEPRSMQVAPRYDDVVGEVETFLLERAEAAIAAGVHRERIWLDPGIGFGKTVEHNLALLAALPRLGSHGYPVLLATSRKRFIATLDPAQPGPDQRLGGSLATALWGAQHGCPMVRCHDVAATVQALTVWSALQEATK